MIERWQAKEVLPALGSRRVVNLTGVRQCGKTTLAESIQLPVARRFTLDDDKVRLAAQGDPQGFVMRSKGGRTGRIRLRTLALGEIRGGRGDFLDHAFNRDFPCDMEPLGKKDVIDLAVRGGYPETIEMDWRERRKWFAAYMDDLLMKDIRDLTEIRKVDALRNVAIWMLTHSSKFFDVSELSAKVGITRETAETYIAALKALYS